ncbi:MAG: YkgJ family cysteine cluster protein [Thermodesulfobacteriota bacterium]
MASDQFFPLLSPQALAGAAPALDRLQKVVAEMDRAYKKASAVQDFSCNGCENNCCYTWFFHHTLAEALFLARACAGLSPEVLARAEDQARSVMAKHTAHDADQGPFRAACPLFSSGLCMVYDSRPMICRLHGVPYRLLQPGGSYHIGPGCAAFHNAVGENGKNAQVMDRTPLYVAMSKLETQMRKGSEFSGKARYTIAGLMSMKDEWERLVAFFRELPRKPAQEQEAL